MRIHHPIMSIAVLLAAGSLTVASGQVRSRDGGPSTSTAQPRPAAPAPAPAPPTTSAPAPAAQPRSAPAEGASVGTASAGGGQAGAAHPRQGRPSAGVAVPRASLPPTVPPVTAVVVPGYYGGGYWPWGYAGLGFGSYFYDPFYAPAPPVYTTPLFSGAIRLKVKPRQAQVYADGYYAGVVDDFDGIFQSLRLEPGPHRLEIRAAGYEPLVLDLQIQPDHTIKYEAEMKPTVN